MLEGKAKMLSQVKSAYFDMTSNTAHAGFILYQPCSFLQDAINEIFVKVDTKFFWHFSEPLYKAFTEKTTAD